MRQVGLSDDDGLAGVADVDGGEVFGSGLVRNPEDSTAVAGLLQREAFAAVTEAVEVVVAEQAEVVRFCYRVHESPPSSD